MAEDTGVVSGDEIGVAIAEGEALSRAGRAEAAIARFRRLVERFPDEPRAHFALGGAHDAAGHEAEAVGPYRRAMELGLAGEDVARWYVQFGSTLRNVGEFDEAVRLLTEGRTRFPEDAAIRVFLVLALHSAGRSGAGLAEVIDLLLSDPKAPDLRGYERAIRWYADEVRSGQG